MERQVAGADGLEETTAEDNMLTMTGVGRMFSCTDSFIGFFTGFLVGS